MEVLPCICPPGGCVRSRGHRNKDMGVEVGDGKKEELGRRKAVRVSPKTCFQNRTCSGNQSSGQI